MLKHLLFWICLMVIFSCSQNSNNGNSSNAAEDGVEVRIIRQMGQLPADTIQYLPLIGNLAEVKSSETQLFHLVLGKDMENGDNAKVKELSTLVYQHGKEIHKLRLSVPISGKYSSIKVDNFEELATKYGSVKWALESWYNHFAGLGKSKFLRWENLNYD